MESRSLNLGGKKGFKRVMGKKCLVVGSIPGGGYKMEHKYNSRWHKGGGFVWKMGEILKKGGGGGGVRKKKQQLKSQ